MIEITVQESADEFVRVLAASAAVRAFQEAKASVARDEEFFALSSQQARMAAQFRSKQFDGTLTQEDISKQRMLYKQVTTHPTNVRYVAARDEVLELLQSCNEAMSSLLGFDFASNAAPAAAC